MSVWIITDGVSCLQTNKSIVLVGLIVMVIHFLQAGRKRATLLGAEESMTTRMVKIIMRLRVRSISGARQVVHGTESCRHARLPGWIAEAAERCPSPDDCAPDDNGPHTR